MFDVAYSFTILINTSGTYTTKILNKGWPQNDFNFFYV